MEIDLNDTYLQISHRKKRSKLYTEDCTAEQIFYQIKDLTSSIIKHVESLLSKTRRCEAGRGHLNPSQDICSSHETEVDVPEVDSHLNPSQDICSSHETEVDVPEVDILDCPKKFFEKMDENVGEKDSSDEITSDYLADLEEQKSPGLK